MALKKYSYIGKGKIHLEAKTGGTGLLPIGNCEALNFAVETNSIDQADYENAGGGLANSVDRISTVDMGMTMLELRPENLKIALRASLRVVAAGAVSDERHIGYVDRLIALDDVPDKTQSITVTIDPDGTPVVATADVDYEVTNAGVYILAGGAISDLDVLGIDYTKVDADVIEAMTGSGEEYKLVFDGLNEAESGRAVVVTIHRVKFSPTTGLELIGDEFASLPLDGSVLSDNAIQGANISRYFKVALAS